MDGILAPDDNRRVVARHELPVRRAHSSSGSSPLIGIEAPISVQRRRHAVAETSLDSGGVDDVAALSGICGGRKSSDGRPRSSISASRMRITRGNTRGALRRQHSCVRGRSKFPSDHGMQGGNWTSHRRQRPTGPTWIMKRSAVFRRQPILSRVARPAPGCTGTARSKDSKMPRDIEHRRDVRGCNSHNSIAV